MRLILNIIYKSVKVFFAFSTSNLKANLETYKRVGTIITSKKSKLTVDLIKKAVREKKNDGITKNEDDEQFHKEAIGGIDEADCVIADASFPSSGVGFQIGYAISLKKPVLCIFSEEFGSRKLSKVIFTMKSPFLQISSYTENTLKSVISKFLDNLPKQYLMKFNFIITPEIDDYLTWLHNKSGKSKSETLREKVVEKVIREDKEYLSSKKHPSKA
ncbi:hypothetical protein CO053_01880 [Candidatus Shapirobacteria bacterium CG_4_9_14_0_2_um_filter_40_11]|uniref:Nucleoside 2-deoxyribosyltransferase n=1 Tax=Candidatus Shapirobacteria bacterium CG_4_9_14_0_2_um_filter_40_11 TaxID=1974876 RepID=A0A2M8EV07_9BACT|nr:MAG: hypothetical protein CO053_01880 [Candidatus Shapirobacteria bacterium CG_4_9_14_0_2_um_filter_40_11]